MGKLLHDDHFKHISYHHTDVAKTFARIRRELKEKAEREKVAQAEAQSKVRRIAK